MRRFLRNGLGNCGFLFPPMKQPQTPAAAYWQTVAEVSIRRLWLNRNDAMVRLSIRGWVRTLRQVR